jgi:AP-4 complex subunit mu-1
MPIAQFFILSPRGDCIISKDFRGDEHPTMHEDFFHKVRIRCRNLTDSQSIFWQVKFWDKGDAPPVFHLDSLNFLFIRRNSLLIACTTRSTFFLVVPNLH